MNSICTKYKAFIEIVSGGNEDEIVDACLNYGSLPILYVFFALVTCEMICGSL